MKKRQTDPWSREGLPFFAVLGSEDSIGHRKPLPAVMGGEGNFFFLTADEN